MRNMTKKPKLFGDKAKAEIILDSACYVLDIDRKKVISRRRISRLIEARGIAMHMTRAMSDLTYSEIGDIYAGRDHSTVINSINRVSGFLDYDDKFRQKYNAIRAEYMKRIGYMVSEEQEEPVDKFQPIRIYIK